MNKRPTFTETIVEFFEANFKHEAKLRLVTLLSYFDSRQKTLPTLEELQSAMQTYSDVTIIRKSDEIYFQQTSKSSEANVSFTITGEELITAYKQHSKEFWETYRRIHKRN